MQILFFILYSSIFIICLKFSFKNSTAVISFKQATSIFLLNTLIGCLYGVVFFTYYNNFNNDTWHYNKAALYEFNLLIKNPNGFFRNLLLQHSNYTSYIAIFDSTNNFWKDLQSDIIIKILVVFNFFTKGNYFTNTLFFNFIVFWGHYYFFKLLLLFYPNKKAISFVIAFLFPTLLFWVSGISKDGLMFLGLSGFLYYLFSFSNNRRTRTLILSIVFWGLIFLIRNFIAVSIIPVITAYFLSSKLKNKSTLAVYTIVIALFILIFSISGFLSNQLDLPQKMADRQEAFQKLEGGSCMYLPQLKPTLSSYLEVLPYALNHAFLRPYIFESRSIFMFFASLESWFVILTILFAFFQIKRLKTLAEHPLLMLLVFLALINYLMIGYTVPFAGAIVRYRVFFEVMLLLPMLIICDSNNKLETWLNKWLRLY